MSAILRMIRRSKFIKSLIGIETVFAKNYKTTLDGSKFIKSLIGIETWERDYYKKVRDVPNSSNP